MSAIARAAARARDARNVGLIIRMLASNWIGRLLAGRCTETPSACKGSVVKVEGRWAVLVIDSADVRLRSGRIGLISIDVRAPVTAGELQVTATGVRFSLSLGLDQLKTGNFLMEGAARSLLRRNDARVLNYSGHGAGGLNPRQVNGHAVSGGVNIELTLTITAVGPGDDPMAEIELAGAANLGTVNVPLPGLGRVENFSFQVDARLELSRTSD